MLLIHLHRLHFPCITLLGTYRNLIMNVDKHKAYCTCLYSNWTANYDWRCAYTNRPLFSNRAGIVYTRIEQSTSRCDQRFIQINVASLYLLTPLYTTAQWRQRLPDTSPSIISPYSFHVLSFNEAARDDRLNEARPLSRWCKDVMPGIRASTLEQFVGWRHAYRAPKHPSQVSEPLSSLLNDQYTIAGIW